MGEIFGLNFHLSYLHTPQTFFFEILPWAMKVIFVTDFVIFVKNPPFFEVNQ
jgi:hypothetical protein